MSKNAMRGEKAVRKLTVLMSGLILSGFVTIAWKPALASPWQTGERRQVEEEIDETIEEIGAEVEVALHHLGKSLERSADRIGESVERWAEENSEELEAWSDKYAQRWEHWAEEWERKMQRLAEDQEAIWEEWARDYKSHWEQWSDELDSDELDSAMVRELVQKNLKMLGKMPLGQMVDDLLDQGLGELGDAPWESLDELGRLAERALDEPLQELSQMVEPGSRQGQEMEQRVRSLRKALDRIGDTVEKRLGDEIEQQRLLESRQIRARIRALDNLLTRDGVTDLHREKINRMKRTLQDAAALLSTEEEGEFSARRPRRDQFRNERWRQDPNWRIRGPGDQPRQKMRSSRGSDEDSLQRERGAGTDEDLERFNEDLRDSQRIGRNKSGGARQRSQNDLGPIGEGKVDASQKGLNESSAQNRDQENRRPVGLNAEFDLLRKEIEKLWQEVESLKKTSGK
jgi:hypothetical protein